MTPAIIIHGGFFSESSTNNEVKEAKQQALKRIVSEAYKKLENSTALEAVVCAVSMLEDCELFNAGYGSQLQSDGHIRLSASLMDGSTSKFSGVINIEPVKNPVQIARKLMDEEDKVLSGAEALMYARASGFKAFDPETEARRKDFEQKLAQSKGRGTVGCVALDADGRLAAATSTGGKGFELPGRVSDSATVAGNYANRYAAVSCTGVGEDIVSGALAAKIVTRVTDGLSLQEATDKSMAELKPFDGFAGIIGISASGQLYHTCSHPYMVWAMAHPQVEVFD